MHRSRKAKNYSVVAYRHSPLLRLLLYLFIARVLGQVVVEFFEPSFLPGSEHWQSGLLSYPVLLVSQIFLIGLGWRIIVAVETQTGRLSIRRPKLGTGLIYFAIVYAILMCIRALLLLLALIQISTLPYVAAWIPIPFHFVIAGFIFVYGKYLRANLPHSKKQLTQTLTPIVLLGLSSCSLSATYLEHMTDLPARQYSSVRQAESTISMPDGVRLRTVVYTPKTSSPLPTILVRAPLPTGLRTCLLVEGIGRTWAKRGYAVVVQGTRGTYGSQGSANELFVHERSDGLATVDWIQEQPFYNGQIFTWGGSYFSFTQWAIADQEKNGLRGMISMIGSSQMYPFFYPGGAFALESSLVWALREGWRIPSDTELDAAAAAWPMLEDVAPFLDQWSRERDMHPYWTQRAGVPAERASVPVLLMAGWYDPFLAEQLAEYEQLLRSSSKQVREHSRLIIGPWAHASTVSMPEGYTPRAYRIASFEPALDWFNFVASENPSYNFPAVQLFTMGSNVWKSEESWPPTDTSPQNFYLTKGPGLGNHSGVLAKVEPSYSSAANPFYYDPNDPLPSRGGALLGNRAGIVLQNEIEARPDVLLFTSEVLKEDMEVTGPVRAELSFSSSVCTTDVTAKLLDVFPDGDSYNVSEGIVRLEHCEATPTGLDLRKITIELQPTSRVFFRGHKIRLLISSSSFPLYDRNLNVPCKEIAQCGSQVAEQQVHHGTQTPSRLVLRIREVTH